MTTLTATPPLMWSTDEPACEASHTNDTECTIRVVGRKTVTCQRWAFNVCQASYTYNEAAITAGHPCDKCHRPCDQCWRIIRI